MGDFIKYQINSKFFNHPSYSKINKINDNVKNRFNKIKLLKNKGVQYEYNNNNDISKNNSDNDIFLKSIINSKLGKQIGNITKDNKTLPNIKYINLKNIFITPLNSYRMKTRIDNLSTRKNPKKLKENIIIKIKRDLLSERNSNSVQKNFSLINIQRYNDFKKFKSIIKANSFKRNNDISINKFETTKNDFLQNKSGIYLYKNKYVNEHFSFLKKYNLKTLINNFKKEKKSNQDIFSHFNKLKSKLLEENKQMRKDIKSSYSRLDNKKKEINLKKRYYDTPQGFRKIFYDYNKKRAEKENILTNIYLEDNINPNKEKYNFKVKKDKNTNIINDKNITNLAQDKINKIYHDLLVFRLPDLDDKIYIRKILYDVFIEFKNVLLLSMTKNKDINRDKKGLDFDSFYNCSSEINIQGRTFAKKLFKVFNNKSDNKYMSFEKYANGMIKLKNSSKENKLNLFFELLDENSNGFMAYEDIYKFGIICLQKITLNLETMEDFNKAKKNKNSKNIKVIETLADHFARMIYKLLNIDVKDNIPLDTLKKMIIQGGEQADYIEFLFGSSNFV